MSNVECKSMDMILNNMNEFIASIDTEHVFTFVNTAFHNEIKRMFDVELHAGDSLVEQISHIPKEQARVRAIWQKALDGEEFIVVDRFGDANIVGEQSYYELSYSPLYEKGSDVVKGAACIIRDVTDREKLKMRAEESLRSKELFLSSISHELRTPMNAILGFGKLLEMDVKDDVRLSTYVRSINRSGNYLLGLINNILDLNKIGSNNIRLSIETINVASTINNICTDTTTLLNTKNVKLINNMDKFKDINITVDLQRYKQVVINLISNAIKYNKDNGTVIVTGELRGDMFCTVVRDTGIGISEENLKDICTPFNRLGNETSDISGSGLGLSITKDLCTIMHGRLDIESRLGIGSTFKACFPISLEKANEQSRDIVDDDMSVDVSEYTGDIFYVEDNTFNLSLMNNIIDRYYPKANYVSHSHGRDAYDYLMSTIPNTPDIILVDINLPGMSGTEIIENIKNNKAFSDSSVIVVTANLNDNVSRTAKDLGVDGFITKPIVLPKFMALMNRSIEGKMNCGKQDH